MSTRKVSDIHDSQLDPIIDKLSVQARKALMREKVSDELHKAGLVKFGQGITELGTKARDRLLNRRQK